nr:hypothetical protein [Nitrosospira sp. Nsp14]
MQGEAGFKKCLQLTLYRPRDILTLLNQSFYNAKKGGREQLILADLEKSAKDISATRLDDLYKEYEVVFPGIANATSIFSNGSPELSIGQSCDLVLDLMGSRQAPEVKQQLEILDSPQEVLRSLYSVGFLGTHDKSSGSFIFCHDGKRPDKEFSSEDRVLIHPCYWMALNLTRNTLNPNEAEEINDEYEIQISSTTPKIREARLGSIIAELGKIKHGEAGAAEFEAWVFKAVKIAFAGQLENIELHPNGAASQRRDIVALNLGKSDFWKLVREKYKSYQVIFEVKNFEDLGSTEYRQMNSYLCNEYGQMGFIVTQSADTTLRADRELDWSKEIYFNHQKLIIKISAKFLANILSKLRAPQNTTQRSSKCSPYITPTLVCMSVAKPRARQQ